MSKVFISYATPDERFATSLVEALESAGLPCWIARRDVSAGGRFPEEVVRQIRESRSLVVLLSGAAFNSQNVLQEVSLANEHKVVLIPIRLDATEVPDSFNYFLTLSQWIEARAAGRTGTVLDVKRIASEVHAAVSQRQPAGPRSAVSPTRIGPNETSLRRLGRPDPRRTERSIDALSTEAAMLGIESRRAKKAVDELESSISRQRHLAAQLAAEESELREKMAAVRERQSRVRQEEDVLASQLGGSRVAFERLRERHGGALQRLRQSEATFDYCRQQMAKVAREAFFVSDDLKGLRIETARAISFPAPPYPEDFVNVFGFLGSAFGLPSARAFWDSIAETGSLTPLQLYNRAVSRLFSGTVAGCVRDVLVELDVVGQRVRESQGSDDDLAACITFVQSGPKRVDVEMRVWMQSLRSMSGSPASLRLRDVVDDALTTLRRVVAGDMASRRWAPALLPSEPFGPTGEVDASAAVVRGERSPSASKRPPRKGPSSQSKARRTKS